MKLKPFDAPTDDPYEIYDLIVIFQDRTLPETNMLDLNGPAPNSWSRESLLGLPAWSGSTATRAGSPSTRSSPDLPDQRRRFSAP